MWAVLTALPSYHLADTWTKVIKRNKLAENIAGCLILTVRPLFVVQYVLPKQMFNNKATVQYYIEDMTRFIGV